MDDFTEPPNKRSRLENIYALTLDLIDSYINKLSKTKGLHAVLDETYYCPLPLVKVFCGSVKDSKELSKIIHILNEKIPLKELQHLKRVCKKAVLLCPTQDLNGMSSIQEYLEANVQELVNSFEFFKELLVPLIPPVLKSQNVSSSWPCNFHPNKYLEKLTSEEFFPENELILHYNFMKMTFDVAKWYIEKLSSENVSLGVETELLSTINATVIVDPKINSVVAASFCNLTHPVQHSTMVAIDSVARTQNGGVWCTDTKVNLNYVLSGFEESLFTYLRLKYSVNNFGARAYKSKDNLMNSSNKADNTPYLCTGYYVYTLKEPCIMCAMALVHARAKRVFFCFDNKSQGALKSRTKLQCIQSLNHHFEVFTGFL